MIPLRQEIKPTIIEVFIMEIRCECCRYWTQETFYTYPGAINCGECDKLSNTDKVDITISAGLDGGYVSKIQTDSDFFCALFGLRSDTND
jgi:hypothetical protein